MTKKITLDDFKEFYEFHTDNTHNVAKGLLEDLALHGFIAIKKPVLTKEILKGKGVAGKTLLMNIFSRDHYLYLGFNRDDVLVTDFSTGRGSRVWGEGFIPEFEILEESND